MMKKAVFIVFLGIVGLSAIFAQAFPVDDSNGDIYTKKDNFGIKQEVVIVEAQQLCMTMRGDLAHGTRTVTSECNGVFKEDTALYQQAWMILGGEKA